MTSSACCSRCEAFATRFKCPQFLHYAYSRLFITPRPTLVHLPMRKCEVANKCKGENREFDPASPHYEFRNRQSLRQKSVDDSFLLQTKLAEHAPVGIDDRRDAGVGGAGEGDLFSPGSFGHIGATGTALQHDPQAGVTLAFVSNRHHNADPQGFRRRISVATNRVLAAL